MGMIYKVSGIAGCRGGKETSSLFFKVFDGRAVAFAGIIHGGRVQISFYVRHYGFSLTG